jgi:hypothetical protein
MHYSYSEKSRQVAGSTGSVGSVNQSATLVEYSKPSLRNAFLTFLFFSVRRDAAHLLLLDSFVLDSKIENCVRRNRGLRVPAAAGRIGGVAIGLRVAGVLRAMLGAQCGAERALRA